MSSKESQVEELRSLVSSHLTPYYDTYFNLLRWIQANIETHYVERLHDSGLSCACAWEVDLIHKTNRDSHPLHKYWPITVAGVTESNSLVLVEQSGFIDYEGIHDHFSVTDIVKAKLHDAESVLARIMEIEKETGKQAYAMLVIDSDGVPYSKKLIDLMLGPMNSRSEFMLQHYVELVDKIVIVNFPSWANALWTMIKPMLPARSIEKIKIQSFLDPSMCPVLWNNENHNEFKLHVERPPHVHRAEKIMRPLDTLEKLHVKAGKMKWLEFNLEKGDTFNFYVTGDSGFGFTIVNVENEDDSKDILSMRTVFPLFQWIHGPFKVPLEDTIVAPESGLYKVWLSNSRAWFYSVTIRHHFEVIKNELID